MAAVNGWPATPAAESGKNSATGTGSGASAWSTGSPIDGYSGSNGVKTYTGGAAADQAPATFVSVAVCLLIAVGGLIL